MVIKHVLEPIGNAETREIETQEMPRTERVSPVSGETQENETRELTINATGIAYDCTECGQSYLSKRPVAANHNPFCCKECRMTYHNRKRKEKRVSDRVG
jgi:endogenous inhibitor of DNA gyrase (YacG/DUF329 family)